MRRKKYCKGEITLGELYNCAKRVKSGCLDWRYSVARNGYGQIRRNGKVFTVTRLVMHLTSGFDLNSKMNILHRCDNPRCIERKHLFEGTTRDNINDKVRKCRHYHGEQVWKAVLTDAKVRTVFRLKQRGWTNVRIARRYGIDRSAISSILNRSNWKHVQLNNESKDS